MIYKPAKIKSVIMYVAGYFCGWVCGFAVSTITVLVLFPILYIKYLLGKGSRPAIVRRAAKKQIVK